MKYDRPVWQIMHECADAMPAVFRYDDVRDWFTRHYPDVNEATIRAHLIGLTEGGRAKHVQFAPRSPVFRRVARGEYEAIPLGQRGEDPHAPAPSSQIKMSANGHHPSPVIPGARSLNGQHADADSTDEDDDKPRHPDILLLGSIGDRVNVPAPAKEVFREPEFQLSRLHAELSGSEWFVLSAEHGLVAPNEWMSPDSRTLADMDPAYRVVWASWVVARLQSLVGSLDDLVVKIDAPDVFTGPLFSDLQDAGAIVSSGAVAPVKRTQAEWVPDWQPREKLVPRAAVPEPRPEPAAKPELAAKPEPAVELELKPEPTEPVADEAGDDDVVLATVTDIDVRASMADQLSNVHQAVPATEVSTLPQTPGLYAWLVDPTGARALNRCLKLPVASGLIFVGHVGGSSWHTMVDPGLNLRDHVDRVQLHGRTRASTFRMTLATVLSGYLGMTSLEDTRLTDWMLEHLSVSAWAVPDGEGLRELAQMVIGELDPPLNVDHLPATEYRARLQQMREALA